MAGGLLSGKFDRHGASDKTSRRAQIQFPPVDEAKTFDIIDVLRDIADRHGVSAAQVAPAWLLAKPGVTSGICGVKRPDQLADNLAALDLSLGSDDLTALDEVSRPAPRYPGWIQTYRADGRVPQGHPVPGSYWTLGERPV